MRGGAWTEAGLWWEGSFSRSGGWGWPPTPSKRPPPPLRVAAVTEETYAAVGRLGLPIFLAVRTSSISELERFVGGYHAGWREAGHPGRGEIGVIVPGYVADTERDAREETEAHAMHFYPS